MMKRGEIALLILAVIVVLVFSGCSGKQDAANQITGAPQEKEVNQMEEKTTGEKTTASGEVKEVKIAASQFAFDPDTITVKKGDKVKLTLTNIDVAHGISIKEFNIDLKPGAGETKSVEFVADKAGTFSMYCNVFCGEGHREMKGTFVVEE